MKPIFRSKTLNQAFKRFQLLPELPHRKPANEGPGLSKVLADRVPSHMQNPAITLDKPIEISQGAMADCFCSQTCE
jgi:hypothetical protein